MEARSTVVDDLRAKAMKAKYKTRQPYKVRGFWVDYLFPDPMVTVDGLCRAFHNIVLLLGHMILALLVGCGIGLVATAVIGTAWFCCAGFVFILVLGAASRGISMFYVPVSNVQKGE